MRPSPCKSVEIGNQGVIFISHRLLRDQSQAYRLSRSYLLEGIQTFIINVIETKWRYICNKG